MKRLIALLACSFLSAVSSDRGSCVGRCDLGFNELHKCQCDSLCHFYRSCCEDYETVCKKVRGDVFKFPEDDYIDINDTMVPDYAEPMNGTVEPVQEPELEPELELEPVSETEPVQEPELEPEVELEPEPEPDLEPDRELVDLCHSQEPFDAFTDLKNGSIFAFQGEYYYELDRFSVVSEHPRLIHDGWGIHGPIDAAFTRINCEGKTYVFKGDSYWRFNNGMLEDGFPALIKNGFPGIPNNTDATLAVPASNIDGNERAYFFKGNSYWEYTFQNQPSQRDCARSSISIPFERYTDFMDDSWEDFFVRIFGIHSNERTNGPHSIQRDWRGIPGPVDSAMIGKLFFVHQYSGNSRKKPKKHPRRNRQRGQRRRHSSSMEMDLFPMFPSQSVYFFVRDKYYRVDLETKQVAYARPRYPRSIARYWFKCANQMPMHE